MPSETKPLTQRLHPTSIVIDKATKDTMHNNQPSIQRPIQPLVMFLSTPHKSPRSCCCRVFCCITSLLLTLIVVFGILALVFYLVYHPKAPDYSVDRLRITDFRLNLDLSLFARFNIRVTAKNPNHKIGIYYEKGGKISVFYAKTQLCQGHFPAFYQSPLNKTRVDVSLSGQNQYGRTLMQALQQQQQTGNIPLDLKVDQPVSIRVQSMKLGKVRILANCTLTVDSLNTNSAVSIKASNCNITLKL